jgi:hypothetical protein
VGQPTYQGDISMIHDLFPRSWTVEILNSPPLITPARHFVYPQKIHGEEEALARGALQLIIKPANGAQFLATCALGFTDPTMPTGVFTCPNPDELCAVSGGYAYIIDTLHPERSTHIALKPVAHILPVPQHGLLLFAGFHTILAWNAGGEAWQTGKLSWEGVKISGVEGDTLHGTGWNLLADEERPFTVDLRTGHHEGGGWKTGQKMAQ